MASTLRMLWPLFLLLGRGLAFAGRGVLRAAGGLGRLFWPPASGEGLLRQGYPPAVEAEIRRIVAAWGDSFCGECKATPDAPQGRCPKCLERLGRILDGAERAA
jgi:hypothetical protein